MNLRNLVAVSATMAVAVVGRNVFAQDDLDDLLKDLEADASAEKADAAPAAATVEPRVEPAAPEGEAPAVKEETPAEPAVEPVAEPAVPVEEPVAEAEAPAAKTEEPVAAGEAPTVAEETAAEEVPAAKAEEAAVAGTKPGDDEVLTLLEELSAENAPEASPAAPAASVAETPSVAADASAPVAPPPARTYSGKDAPLIAQLKATEVLRRKAFDAQAKRVIATARSCMQTKEYMEAAKQYRIAQKLLNDSPASEGLRKECEQGVAEGLYRAALQEETTGRRDRAVKLMTKAVDLRHPKARRQLEQWLASDDPEAAKVDVSEIAGRRNEADYKNVRAKNLRHLRRARQLLGTRELDRALDECELVLISDPYNQEAIRLREKIELKMRTIVTQERKAARDGMIADVDKAWRPPYAIDARAIEKSVGQTVTTGLDKDPERAQEQMILKRMREMMLPEISFKPPATIFDAVQFFIGASKDYDRPDLPLEERGFGFQMITPQTMTAANPAQDEGAEGFGAGDAESSAEAGVAGAPVIPTISVNNISFFDALTLICESVGYKFKVKNGIVVVMPKDMSTEEMVTRSYPVLSTFMDQMSTATSDLKEMKSGGFGGGSNQSHDDGEENQERDWKEFFSLLGVQWPEGSSIMYIKTIGKLRVKNTYENLAELEKALTEMNVDSKLIEIEARFVEVSQEDLNSLGFEWILNSDYTLGLNQKLGKALGIRNGQWPSAGVSGSTSAASSTLLPGQPGYTTSGGTITGSTSGSSAAGNAGNYANTHGATWVKGSGSSRNVGISKFGGEGATHHTGMRYLSTMSNHISGEGYSNNDQFMRVNAFLGNADLSMILHMLSQRSDTDLLSAPKVLTMSEQNAVMKVVTEYIYPTDYDVQLQSSSSSSGGSNSGGSQSAILAVVEPQSFTMREVGVILDVTPRLTDNGNLIDLELKTQVVDEPTWKNYGMRIPFTGNSSLQSFEGIGGIFEGLTGILQTLGTGLDKTLQQSFAEQAVNSATKALDNLSASSADNMTYYDAPMEQPFFHVRSIESKVSVYPGATIVMGGLITEARKAMDDKIPFLGDLPFVGRFFRSHSEQTNKRNLLIFLTTRLVDVRGREVAIGSLEAEKDAADTTPLPEAAE